MKPGLYIDQRSNIAAIFPDGGYMVWSDFSNDWITWSAGVLSYMNADKSFLKEWTFLKEETANILKRSNKMSDAEIIDFDAIQLFKKLNDEGCDFAKLFKEMDESSVLLKQALEDCGPIMGKMRLKQKEIK